MAERIVLCSACGQKNRILPKKGIARCGSCKKELAIDGHDPSGLGSTRLWLLAGLAIVGVLGLAELQKKPTEPTPAPHSSASPIKQAQTAPAFSASPLPISTGIVSFPSGYVIAPIRIRASSGSNFFVRLVHSFTKAHIMEIYLEGGDTFEGKVPLGSYEIRYASGNVWYGEDLLFGPSTQFHKAEKTFNFTRDGDSISGYTVELVRQRGGNLRTSTISRGEF